MREEGPYLGTVLECHDASTCIDELNARPQVQFIPISLLVSLSYIPKASSRQKLTFPAISLYLSQRFLSDIFKLVLPPCNVPSERRNIQVGYCNFYSVTVCLHVSLF